MAKNVGLTGDITNKSRRVTSVMQMLATWVPNDMIAKETGHCNLKTLDRYDRVAILKAKARQNLLCQPYDPVTKILMTFEDYYNLVMMEYHYNQVGHGNIYRSSC